MTSEPLTVGFVGLGTMGFPMAANLISKLPKGSKMYVYDIAADSVRRFQEQHPDAVVVCGSAKEVTEPSTVVFTMVPEGSHVRAAFLDKTTGILAATPGQRVFLDCSTIDRETSLAIHSAVSQQHPASVFMDTPVSGGEIGAERGTLTFMAGCAEDHAQWPFVRSLVGLMGTTLLACGGPALGVTAKLTNNYCSALISLATAEAMNLGMRAGMDPRLLQRIFSKSTAQSTMCDRFNPVPGLCPDTPASHGYRGGFKVQLMRKDVGLAVQIADDVGATLLLGRPGLQAYEDACADPRCIDLDSRIMYRFIGGDEEWEKKLAKP